MELNTARKNHACGHYRDTGGQDVLLVTGGYGIGGGLSSTEISEDQGVLWRIVESAALPSARWGIRAATYNNRLFVFGTIYDIYAIRSNLSMRLFLFRREKQ